MNIWFTSDTHYDHWNIDQHCNRGFLSLEEMNETLIENYNKLVKPTDTLYHLGDFALKGASDRIFNRLNGKKHLIKGNHDRNNVLLLDWKSIKEVDILKIDNQLIFLSHYPHRSWPHKYHGSYHLYGHVHGTMEDYDLSCDVGVDCWEFKPVHLDVIFERFKNK